MGALTVGIFGLLLAFSVNFIRVGGLGLAQAENKESELSLGTGRRQAVKVDYQKVNFPHKMHQELLLKRFSGDKEQACTWCHHTKRPGKDPQACRRCHAGRMRQSKGGGAGRQTFLAKRTRPGKMMKLKDVFHALCKGCHEEEREKNLEYQADPKKTPVEACEGCHLIPEGAAVEKDE